MYFESVNDLTQLNFGLNKKEEYVTNYTLVIVFQDSSM